jgi:hypothetical protein
MGIAVEHPPGFRGLRRIMPRWGSTPNAIAMRPSMMKLIKRPARIERSEIDRECDEQRKDCSHVSAEQNTRYFRIFWKMLRPRAQR